MRQIKFRVFDLDTKEMSESFDLMDFAYDQDGEHGNFNFSLSDGRAPKETFYPLMQFTGLIDKNGKEIWEGDITRVSSHNNPMETVYDNQSAMFRTKGKGMPSPLVSWVGLDIEVVGDIYSNPELLDKP